MLLFGMCCLVFWLLFRKRKSNPYVTLHRLKIKNDRNYKAYLKWCLSVGEIPMDKYDYIKEIAEREGEINKALK